MCESSLPTDPVAVRRLVERRPDRATPQVCDETGPTGCGWARQLAAWAVPYPGVVPELVPTKTSNRVKTDRRTRRRG